MNGPTINTITCRELHDLAREQPIELIDVRTPEEFQSVRAAGARNIPLGSHELLEMLQRPSHADESTIFFICEVGARSGRVCAAFMSAGHPNVVNVEGGTQAWIEARLPVESSM
jgi:rhodanese-related sulfurtransferase